MKWKPADIDQMTFAEYYAAIKGYVASVSVEQKVEPPTEEEYYRVLIEEQAAGRA